MAIISRRLLEPDDPIFNGGVEVFTVRKSQKPPEPEPETPLEDTDEEGES